MYMYPQFSWPCPYWQVMVDETHGGYPYISIWDEPHMGPIPTDEEFEAAWYVLWMSSTTANVTKVIRDALDDAMSAYTQYPVNEVDGWDALYEEAKAWVDSAGVIKGHILTEYEANIGTLNGQPADTLAVYCPLVVAKNEAWREEYGKQLALRRTRTIQLDAILAGINADPPTHTTDDLTAFYESLLPQE